MRDDEAGLVKGVRIPIKAQFLLDGRSTDELRFVEEEVRILHFDDCAYATVDENERAQIIGKKSRDKRRAKYFIVTFISQPKMVNANIGEWGILI